MKVLLLTTALLCGIAPACADDLALADGGSVFVTPGPPRIVPADTGPGFSLGPDLLLAYSSCRFELCLFNRDAGPLIGASGLLVLGGIRDTLRNHLIGGEKILQPEEKRALQDSVYYLGELQKAVAEFNAIQLRKQQNPHAAPAPDIPN